MTHLHKYIAYPNIIRTINDYNTKQEINFMIDVDGSYYICTIDFIPADTDITAFIDTDTDIDTYKELSFYFDPDGMTDLEVIHKINIFNTFC